MKYIYLDWNVIQYIKHKIKIEKKSIDGEKFGALVEKLKKIYIFPFSEAHLRDLSISKEEYHEENLNYLSNYSNNSILGFLNENIVVIPITKNEINNFFIDIIKIQKEEQDNLENKDLDYFMSNSFQIDLNKINKHSILKPYLENNKGILDSNMMNNFFLDCRQNMNNPKFYKLFRTEVSKLKKNFELNSNTVINQQSQYFKDLKPFLDFILMDDIELMKKNFSEIIKSFLKINNERTFESMTIGAKIDLVYSLIDYNPNFRDEIDKKNKPFNILRDIKHLHFASQSKYYVTGDDTSYKKSKFVVEVLDLKTKVLTMSELINKIDMC